MVLIHEKSKTVIIYSSSSLYYDDMNNLFKIMIDNKWVPNDLCCREILPEEEFKGYFVIKK